MNKTKIESAKEIIESYLKTKRDKEYILLADIASLADKTAGKSLFDSLSAYGQLVKATKKWMPAGKVTGSCSGCKFGCNPVAVDQPHSCGSLLVVENPYYGQG